MGEKANEIINSMKKSLSDGPKSISDISKELEINWRTAEQYLELLKSLDIVLEADVKNTRTFFYKDKDNYFELPIRNKDSKLISTMYHHIKKFCLNFHNKEPTKTQVYKILWKVDQKLKKNLPIGGYMFGPMCVQEYKNNEKEEIKLDDSTTNVTKEITKEYCACDNIVLQKRIYSEVGNKLYQTKEEIISVKDLSKEEINPILMDLIKFSPPETVEVITDFARATLLLGWNKTKELFDDLWKYVTMINFRESLRHYYGDYIDVYLNDKIKESKKEIQIQITDLVRCNVKAK